MNMQGSEESKIVKRRIYLAVPIVVVVLVVVILAIIGVYRHASFPKLNIDSKDVTITLDRDACYGGCPTYTLTIKGDGSVDFIPKPNGFELRDKPLAEGHGQITGAQLRELIQSFEDSGFFTMQEEYVEQGITDLAWATTTIQIDGQTKRVRHYQGDGAAPDELTALEDKIDQIVGTDKWLDP